MLQIPGGRFLLVMLAVGGVLSTTQSQAAERNRAQVFLAGMAEDLKHQAGELTNVLRGELGKNPAVQLLDLAERLKAPPPEKTTQFMGKAKDNLKAAKLAMREMEHTKAAKHAAAARTAFEKMGGYLEPLDSYKEALLILGVAHCMQGDIGNAKGAFLDLLLLDSHLELPKASYESFVLDVFAQVQKSLDKQARGSLSIKTEPPGANLYVDGKLRGVTPESMDGITAGNHLVVVKLPGYANWGRVVKVAAGGHEVQNIKLGKGKAGSGFMRTADRACAAISDDDLRGEVLRLGQNVGMDWAILGQLKHDDYDLHLNLYLFEFSRAEVVYEDQLVMDATGNGAENDVKRFGGDFIRRGLKALKRMREEGDPLSGQAGTEAWNEDNSAKGKEHGDTRAQDEGRRHHRKAETEDPLDEHDGTEDW